ncbi:MAG: hypothetical protein Q4B87_03445 [Candidatus Saccharibacteria bacterium]|nr:hypothetical protein [Candidatus Saccharibacteria bacterium]
MITLNFLKFLENNGFGTIDEDLFWQKLSLGRNGIYIVNIGEAQNRGRRRSQRFELYSRASSDFEALHKLEEIIDFVNNAYPVCALPAVPEFDIDNGYSNITILPISTPTRVGEDENDRIIWSASGTIIY